MGAGGSNEKIELNSVDARVPFKDFSELESVDPFSPLVLFLVKSVQYGDGLRDEEPIVFEMS